MEPKLYPYEVLMGLPRLFEDSTIDPQKIEKLFLYKLHLCSLSIEQLSTIQDLEDDASQKEKRSKKIDFKKSPIFQALETHSSEYAYESPPLSPWRPKVDKVRYILARLSRIK